MSKQRSQGRDKLHSIAVLWHRLSVIVPFACNGQRHVPYKSALVLLWKGPIMWPIQRVNPIIKFCNLVGIANIPKMSMKTCLKWPDILSPPLNPCAYPEHLAHKLYTVPGNSSYWVCSYFVTFSRGDVGYDVLSCSRYCWLCWLCKFKAGSARHLVVICRQ